MSKVITSISGMRGIIGESLDPHLLLKMGMAFGQYIGKGPVIVGGDTRRSYDMVRDAVVSGLLSVGTDVIDIGRVLTPTVQHMIRHYSAKGGVVISASHNPIEWNGLKFMNHQGSFLTPEEYISFENICHQETFPLKSWKNVGETTTVTDAIETHIDTILSTIDTKAIQKSRLNVIIDPNNGAGALAVPILFEKLGISYEIINKEPNGNFAHNPEPRSEYLGELSERLKHGHFDIGFAQDADADRLVILDEKGQFIGEDYSLGFCMDYILSKESSQEDSVVVNLSTSLLIEKIAQKYGVKTHYTKVGETNVTQGIRHTNAIAGGEGNGGIIYPKVGFGRDSLVGIVLALSFIAERSKTVSEIVSEYPSYVMIKDKIGVTTRSDLNTLLESVKSHFSGCLINTEDGVKVSLDNSWLHIRPSNTEPIVRIYAEADSMDNAKDIISQVRSLL